MNYKLRLRYVYTYYNFDEIFDTDAIEQVIDIADEQRFTLHLQEDSSFIVSELKNNAFGNFVILTFPNKDNLIVKEGEEVEIAYDEFFDSMGNFNHNVYEGTATLQAY